jgi:hypothetical protein
MSASEDLLELAARDEEFSGHAHRWHVPLFIGAAALLTAFLTTWQLEVRANAGRLEAAALRHSSFAFVSEGVDALRRGYRESVATDVRLVLYESKQFQKSGDAVLRKAYLALLDAFGQWKPRVNAVLNAETEPSFRSDLSLPAFAEAAISADEATISREFALAAHERHVAAVDDRRETFLELSLAAVAVAAQLLVLAEIATRRRRNRNRWPPTTFVVAIAFLAAGLSVGVYSWRWLQ